MKLTVRVQPNATEEKARVVAENELKIWVKAKPVGGEANKALITFLKKAIKKKTGTSPQISIATGGKSKSKIIEIDCSWKTVKNAISVRSNN